MKAKTLQKAIDEAERFIERAKALRDLTTPSPNTDFIYGPPIESGACQRASMDLTRALADLRQGR